MNRARAGRGSRWREGWWRGCQDRAGSWRGCEGRTGGQGQPGWWRGWVGVALVGITATACDGGPAEPRPTRIVVTPERVDFEAVGASRELTARVLDQYGDTLWAVIPTWTSSDPAVVGVTPGGQVRSVGPGTAVVRAAADDAAGEASVHVAQVATVFRADRGEGQTGPAGHPLPTPVQVAVRDAEGSSIAGATVRFSVASGDGTVAPTTVVTDAQGMAAAVWTLGRQAGAGQRVRATLKGSAPPPVDFTAVGVAGPASQLTEVAGNGQVGLVDSRLALPLQVALRDAFGNPVAATTVHFSVVAGSGRLSQSAVPTGALGTASTNWTLGSAVGAQRVRATVGSLTLDFVATAAATAGPPVSIETVAAAGELEGLAGFLVDEPARVVVRDEHGIGVEGVEVAFAPAAGSVEPSHTTTNRSGVAATQWRLGVGPGVQQLVASVPAQAGVPPRTITAEALDPGPVCALEAVDSTRFNIGLCLLNPISPALAAAFDAARERWEAIIVGDVAAVPARPEAARE